MVVQKVISIGGRTPRQKLVEAEEIYSAQQEDEAWC